MLFEAVRTRSNNDLLLFLYGPACWWSVPLACALCVLLQRMLNSTWQSITRFVYHEAALTLAHLIQRLSVETGALESCLPHCVLLLLVQIIIFLSF